MLDLASYQKIRAYISAFAIGDSRIADGAFVWGPDKRLLDKQASTVPSPFFWVSEYRKIMRSFQANNQVYFGWELKVEVKGAVGAIDNKSSQEIMMEKTNNILSDFRAWLTKEHQKGRIILDTDSRTAIPDEGFEMEGTWGWETTITIATSKNCCKVSGSTYSVYTLFPTWSGSAGNLTITVSGVEISIPWPEERRIPEVLHNLAKAINDSVAPESAQSDADILFIRDENTGANHVALDLVTNNDHAWDMIEVIGV